VVTRGANFAVLAAEAPIAWANPAD